MTNEEARFELLAIARREIGIREQGGNNCGPRIREYQRATWLKPDPWPWCAAFVDWCVREWLQVAGVRFLLGIENSGEANRWRPRTAGAFDLENWARSKGLQVLPPHAPALPGDIVTFTFSHVGFVVIDQGETLVTVEGNTNGKGDRDSATGDGVWQKTRPRSAVRHLIRILP